MFFNNCRLWNGKVPESCRVQHPDEPWKCFFGYRIYRTLKTPLFVVQWLFDEAQMAADNVANPMSRTQWDYIHKMGLQIRTSLENVTWVEWKKIFFEKIRKYLKIIKLFHQWRLCSFLHFTHHPDHKVRHIANNRLKMGRCSNSLIFSNKSISNWAQIKINQISLPQAIHCWESHQNAIEERIKRNHPRSNFVRSRRFERRHYLFNHLDHSDKRSKVSFNAIPDNPIYSQLQTSSLVSNTKKTRKKKKTRKTPYNSHHPSTSHVNQLSSSTANQQPDGRVKQEWRHSKKEMRTRRSSNDPYLSALASLDRNQIRTEDLGKCSSFRLMDSCSWPQCNHRCPALMNPLTGEQVHLTELLRSFGFNMASFASSMGIDPQTFNSMDQRLLLQLLTQDKSWRRRIKQWNHRSCKWKLFRKKISISVVFSQFSDAKLWKMEMFFILTK